MMAHPRGAWASLVIAIVFGLASSAFAQTQVQVTRENAIIWGREARVPITTVKSGTVLEVVGRDGAWYIVRIPPESGGKGEVGLIASTQVELVPGSPALEPQRPSGASPGARPPTRTPGASATRTGPGVPTEAFGFGQVGYSTFLAQNTFNAIFGTPGAPALGGGARINFQGRWFVEGSLDWMEKTGQRVVVAGGQTFPLGISDRVRLLPVSVNAGYRHPGRTVTPYVGGGVGVVFYQETSQFADPSENVNAHFTSYQGVVGFEVGSPRGAVRTAVEVQFATVPGALGSSGASAAFNEHNLGGVQVRVKILAGRKR